jgi:DNA repair exonuclease SbcCD ATPase subunit
VHFEKVLAHAFGPFHDRSLELRPGLNVIYGPNESGKSTWHAALFAGLCGLRRGSGRHSFSEAFATRHRPWDDEQSWRVGSLIVLADGRRVELSHDLANRVDSSAKDADLAGRDYSAEVLFEGAPDGSKWLGLNRNTFLSTACIRQTQMLGVLEDATALQEDLQKAASTAGDATAKAALDLIAKFRAEEVGSERAPTKPLRSTAAALERASLDLSEAERSQHDYLDRLAGIERLSQELGLLNAEESALEAILMEQQAAEASARLERINELAATFRDGPPHRSADEETISNQIATALQKWQGRPDVPTLSGEPVPQLESRLRSVEDQITSTGEAAPPRRQRNRALLAAGLTAAALGGVGLALADPVFVGGGLIALAIGLLVGWFLSGPAQASQFDRHAELARLNTERDHIEHLIDDRRNAERAHQEAVHREGLAVAAVTEAAAAIGQTGSDTGELAETLFSWQKDRRKRLDELAHRQAEWDSYQNLLGLQTVDEIALEAERLRSEAAAAKAGCHPDLIESLQSRGATVEDLKKVRERSQSTRDEIHTLNGELRQFAGSFRGVPEAEEALDMARQEHARVRDLDGVLATTIEFLETAEEEVNRSLAPVLRDTVETWLSTITGGRYTECKVDPESLQVEVRGPGIAWRRADLLSHGTREQVYLLLRLALARHLTTPGESCPLILDDVLASFDHERRNAVLETLHTLSTEVQVVLFTHDLGVAQWARSRFNGANDSLTELERVAG